MKKVDARGDACPIPVVKAKHAIEELSGAGQVEVLVDNEIAVQNLTKMAEQKGYQSSAKSWRIRNIRLSLRWVNRQKRKSKAGAGCEACVLTAVTKGYHCGCDYTIRWARAVENLERRF